MSKNKNELMSLSGAIFTGIGSSIGVAMVAYIGFVIASAGKASFLSIIMGLTIGLCAGYPMYFLTKNMVVSGGQSQVVEAGLGKPSAAFAAYSSIATLGFMSTYPVSITSYIVSVFPGLAPYQMVLSVIVLVFAIGTLCFGVNLFEKSAKLFSYLLLFGLTAFVVLGMLRIFQNGVNPFDFSDDPIYSVNGMNGVLSAIPLFAATCGGFTNIGYLGSLVSEPKKNVPKAIVATSCVMSFFWIFLTIVAANVLPVQEVAGQPLTMVARSIMPEWLAVFFALTGPTMAILTTFVPGLQMTAASIGLVAKRGFLPKFLAPKEGATGIDRRLIIMIGFLLGAIMLLGLPVNVIVSNIAPCTAFAGVMMPNIAHLMIAFRRTDLIEDKKSLTGYRIMSAVGTVAGAILFYLSIRAITLTSALINIGLIVIAYTFCIWKNKRDAQKAAEA